VEFDTIRLHYKWHQVRSSFGITLVEGKNLNSTCLRLIHNAINQYYFNNTKTLFPDAHGSIRSELWLPKSRVTCIIWQDNPGTINERMSAAGSMGAMALVLPNAAQRWRSLKNIGESPANLFFFSLSFSLLCFFCLIICLFFLSLFFPISKTPLIQL